MEKYCLVLKIMNIEVQKKLWLGKGTKFVLSMVWRKSELSKAIENLLNSNLPYDFKQEHVAIEIARRWVYGAIWIEYSSSFVTIQKN